MTFYRPDNRVSLPRSSGTSKIYTKGCSLGFQFWALLSALKEALLHGAIFSCMEMAP